MGCGSFSRLIVVMTFAELVDNPAKAYAAGQATERLAATPICPLRSPGGSPSFGASPL
jgi:hypothetical protein